MKVDYFCFSVPNLGTTDYNISDDDDENTIWIKTKEKELMDSAQKNNMLIVFNRTDKKFYLNGEEFDVKGSVIFPRSFMCYAEDYAEELLGYLEESGALTIQTKEDLEKIMNWPQRIQPMHRRIVQTSYKEFQDNVEYYKLIFKNIFFKTAKKSDTHCVLKSFGYIDIGGEKYFVTKPTLWGVALEDSVFLSDVFKPIIDKENDMDCREYRVFVLNNTLLSISRSYVDYPTKVPNDVKMFAEEQIKRVASMHDFPSSYVLDIGQVLIDDSEVIDIIEYNPIISSGLEVCNLLVDELINQELTQKPFVKKRSNPNIGVLL